MDRYRDYIYFLISKVEVVIFIDILEVEMFVKWIDDELFFLVDERVVLKYFFKWLECKVDLLREVVCSYRVLKSFEIEILLFKENLKEFLK